MSQVDDLLRYVNGQTTSAVDQEVAAEAVSVATSLVAKHAGDAEIPQWVRDRAILECATELWHRRNAPHGIAQFATDAAPATRIARDPMTPAYAILAPYLGAGIA